MFKKILSLVSLLVLTSFLAPSVSKASEGFFELRNQVGESSRCHITSILMSDQNYKMLFSCRDILYPGGTEVFSYVVWAVPADGGNAFRLGTLGLGKGEYRAKEAFSSIFVTKELSDNPRSPTGTVVLRGNLARITSLDSGQNQDPIISDNELDVASPSPSPVTRVSSGNNIFRIIAAGGIVAFLGLFGVILIIFVISRR